MEARAEFLKKLNGLVAVAKGQGDQITIDEVKAYFADAALTEEQLELVFDYLLAQKIVVKGYIKMTEATEEKLTYTEEEEAYLKEVVTIAKEMYHPEIFLGDIIQEGNVGLILGLDMLVDVATAHETIVNQVKQCIQMLIEEHAEVKSRDNKMVEKVTMLDESIKALTEELGRKVTIDELAVYMGMTEEEIDDILRLMGEESEEEEEAE